MVYICFVSYTPKRMIHGIDMMKRRMRCEKGLNYCNFIIIVVPCESWLIKADWESFCTKRFQCFKQSSSLGLASLGCFFLLTSTILTLIPTPIYLPGPLGLLGCDHHQTTISFWVFFLVPSTQYFGAGNNNDNSKHMSSWSFGVYNSSTLDRIRV